LALAVSRSSSDGVAISYVLSVLSMTSCFHTVKTPVWCVACINKRREVTAETTASIPTEFCSTIKIGKTTSLIAQWGRSLLCKIACQFDYAAICKASTIAERLVEGDQLRL